MNAQRRKDLDNVHTKLMEALMKLEEVKNELEYVHEEEEEARDNMPESLQESERYQRMDEIVGIFEDSEWSIDDAVDTLEEVLGNLWDIIHEND